jgi:cytochrome c biogenesis protein ResB
VIQQPPLPPEAPVVTPGVTIDGVAITNAQAVYQGFRAQRRELTNQLERLTGTRSELAARLENSSLSDASKKGLEQRLASMDERIAAVDKQIMETDAQIARSVAVPGAAIDLPEPRHGSDDDGMYVIGTVFVLAVLMPLAIAYSRRIWRRSAKVITTFPKELSDRLIRVEQSVEATALEVERIGEGQRFMTRLFTEGAGAQALVQRQPERIPAGPQGNQGS